jgi:hypothetical protein
MSIRQVDCSFYHINSNSAPQSSRTRPVEMSAITILRHRPSVFAVDNSDGLG